MPMTPDEVVKELEALYKTGNNFLEADEPEAIRTAISLIQDYQKLRERVSVEKIEEIIRSYGNDNLFSYSLSMAGEIVEYLKEI